MKTKTLYGLLFLSLILMSHALLLLWSQGERMAIEGYLESLPSPEWYLEGEDELEVRARANREEILVLAQAIYSETKNSAEQEIVGWVIRNRVEKKYRGETYREVILYPEQFSAFTSPKKRRFHLSLSEDSEWPGWRETLDLAHRIYFAPAEENPVHGVLHFYSPSGMKGGRTPKWARGRNPVGITGVSPGRLKAFRGLR